jgi:predicted ATPase
MYLRTLQVNHLKLLRDVKLDFTDVDGKSIRKWTVIIGKNGTGKTSILQAAALAAAGGLQVNTLAGRTVGHLRDRRTKAPLQIDATFEFWNPELQNALHPLIKGPITEPLQLTSETSLKEGETSLRSSSRYLNIQKKTDDPLDDARSRNMHRWFVAGYGVARTMTDIGRSPTLDRPSIERMLSLFDPDVSLIATNFATYFSNYPGTLKAAVFDRVLKLALLNATSLLPDIIDFELNGSITRPGDLQEKHIFLQRVGALDPLQVPAAALAHGYHSTIAWLADLVGHVLLEAKTQVEPDDMEGVVLVDEIDSYLHPLWQATIIPALRATFPKMQFIATTHSPVVLSGVAPHEIVRLASWGTEGDVLEVVHHPETGELVPARECLEKGIRPDARMMTGSEIFREHFGVESPTPNPHGDELRRFTLLASDPFRTNEEHKEMLQLRKQLISYNFTELPLPVKRKRQ